VNQSWFGHRAKKKTMLYICGTKKECIPSCSPNFNMVEYALENKKKSTFKKRLPKKERVATPLPFALFLIEMVKTCNSNLIWI
jgi:hypothetical protein